MKSLVISLENNMSQLEFDFVKDLKSKDEVIREEQDEIMKQLYKNNLLRFYEIMSYYRIPKTTSDEIIHLCRWS